MAAPRGRCVKCGYPLLEGQSRCPECGFEHAQTRAAKRRIPQLYTQGPAAVKPVALRFALMGATALLGPLLALVQSVVLPLAGVAPVPPLDSIVATLAAPLPFSVLLALPYGRGSLGGSDSPIPIEWPSLRGVSLHLVAGALSLSWWIVAALCWLPFTNALIFGVLVVALIGASAGSYLHLSWLAALGEAVADEGPRWLHNWCIGIGLLAAIVSLIIALSNASWNPFFVGLFVAFLSTLAAQVAGPAMLARDMLLTLVESYEELGRVERRARRAAEHEPRIPR